MRKLIALVLAALALAAQKVWDGTKWVARAMSGVPTPPDTGIEDAMDAVACRAAAPVTASQPAARDAVTPAPKPEVAPKPAPAPVKIVELDPVLARGKLAVRFAEATFSLEPEETILAEADEVLAAWLVSLNAKELMAIHRAGVHKVAAHLAGKRPLEGVPEIATEAEFQHHLGQAARMTPQRRADIAEWNATFDAAIDEMTADPAYEVRYGV